MFHGYFSSTCWIMYVAVGSDDGSTSWRLIVCRLKRCRCSQCIGMMPVSYVHCARGQCLLFVCLVHVGVWRCVICAFSWHSHVDHRVVWHIILTLRCSMRTLFPLRFHDFRAIHCETLATRLYLKSCGVLHPARRHVCFATF